MIYKLTLLLMCMDVHPNPGPTSSDNSSLDILHVNTRGFHYKLEYLSCLSESYHILCFSETHLDANVDTSSLTIEGFDTPIRKDRTRNDGGIMVYVSALLKYKRREDLENNRFETIWIEVNLISKILLICSFYRSDFNITKTEFIKELQSSIELALEYTPNVVLTVDININFINLVNSELRDCLNLFNLTNVINEPTRVVGHSATFIDPVLVNDA